MRKLFLLMALLLAVMTAGCGGGGGGVLESNAPTVTGVYPANGDINVALLTTITVTFDKAMNQTNPASWFSISPSINGDFYWSEDGKTLIIIPSTPLTASTLYSCTVGTGAQDLSGHALASAYSWSWTTGSTTDTTSPTVLSVLPVNTATNVTTSAADIIIKVVFSEAMDTVSTQTAFAINVSGYTYNAANFTWVSKNIMYFTPPNNLSTLTLYTCTLGTGTNDLAGNPLNPTPYTWSWTTGSESADDVLPYIASVAANPSKVIAGVVYINSNSPTVTAIFSKAMDHATTEAALSILDSGLNDVTGTPSFGWSGDTQVTISGLSLADGTYTFMVDGSAKDQSSNELGPGSAPYDSVPYQVTVVIDTVQPQVTAGTPTGSGISISGPTIEVDFTEAMDKASTMAAFTINGVHQVDGVDGDYSWNLNPDGTMSMYYAPYGDASGNLSPGATYTCAVAATATDLAGNPLVNSYSWNFITDTVPGQPFIWFVSPRNSATGVNDTSVMVTFSQRMNKGTAQGAFSITPSGGSALSGSFTWMGNTMIFTPSGGLTSGVSYTCTVTTGAQNSHGTPIKNNPYISAFTAPYTWSFTTGDTTHPYIVAVTPLAGSTGVSTGSNICVTFNKAMNHRTTQSAFSTRMFMPRWAYRFGRYTWSGDSKAMCISVYSRWPFYTGLLRPNTTYRCTVSTRATDTFGNHLMNNPDYPDESPYTAPYTWTFGTGSGSI